MHRTLSTLRSFGQPRADANGVAIVLRNLKHQSLCLFENYQVHFWDAVMQEKKIVLIKNQ